MIRIGRAFFVGIVALSVAMLPIVGSTAHAAWPKTAVSLTSPDCCPHDKTCDKQMPASCDLTGACAAKCSSLNAAMAGMPGLMGIAPSLQKPVMIGENFGAGSQSPPLPPPRL